MSGRVHHFFVFFFLLVLVALFSCENSMNEIKSVGSKDRSPEEAVKDVELIFSDSGVVQALMKSPLLKHYNTDRPYTEMPNGIKVFFYDSAMNVQARLSANSAINYEKEKIMDAKSNVVVINTKGEKLVTEHLVWDQKKRIIYSDVFVTITTKDEVLIGNGMESDDAFDKWHINHVTGSFNIKK
jgi:LPS export ABC transporter protein LptC